MDTDLPFQSASESRDPQEAEAMMAALYGSIRVGAPEDELVFRQRVTADRTMSWARTLVGATLEVVSDDRTAVTVARIRGGDYAYRLRDEGAFVPRGGSFLSPADGAVHASMRAADFETIQLQTDDLDDAQARLMPYARSTPLTHMTAFPDSALAEVWWRMAENYLEIMRTPELYRHPLLRESARDQLFATSLVAMGLVEAPPEHPASESVVRRAEAFVEDHLAEPLSVARIAAAVGTSVRALQQAFRRVRSTTPLTYVKVARLHAARRELLHADPARATVGAVAHSWGFANLGRFAAEYRATFGSSPAADLKS